MLPLGSQPGLGDLPVGAETDKPSSTQRRYAWATTSSNRVCCHLVRGPKEGDGAGLGQNGKDGGQTPQPYACIMEMSAHVVRFNR